MTAATTRPGATVRTPVCKAGLDGQPGGTHAGNWDVYEPAGGCHVRPRAAQGGSEQFAETRLTPRRSRSLTNQLPAGTEHTGEVDRSDQLVARPGARRSAVRWLLGMVLAGVFAMHVLSQPSAAGGHGMLMGLQSGQSTLIHSQDGSATGSMASTPPTTVMATPDNSMSSMAACCILFLVVGAAAALLALLVSVDARTAVMQRLLFSGLLDLSRRGPPGRRPPRISLCVLRV